MKRLSALWANNKLLHECVITGNRDIYISSVTNSSLSCKKNSLFVAKQGIHTDGHTFIEEAIKNGAVAILYTHPIDYIDPEITYIQTQDATSVAALLSYNLYGPYPEHIIGVTGTDGKSSTCEFLYTILSQSGYHLGLLSTISLDNGNGKGKSPYRMSTPEADVLYPFMHQCYLNGVDYLILETTSHGLSEKTGRLSHIQFCGAIITNITSEHLDFHGNIECYIDDKMNLVRQLTEKAPVVINNSFLYKDRVKSLVKESEQILTYSESDDSFIRYSSSVVDISSREVSVQKGDEKVSFSYQYAPRVYLHNVVGALTLAHVLTGKPLKELISPHFSFNSMPGRYECLYNKNGIVILNDFAHTPDAFFNLFSHIKEVLPNYTITVLFGAAGERDTSKREGLGHMASLFCDIIYLTQEDPRYEDPMRIVKDIENGFIEEYKGKVNIILDREKAIRVAISELSAPHILLLLGKGHEESINFGSTIMPWNESMKAMEIIKEVYHDQQQ